MRSLKSEDVMEERQQAATRQETGQAHTRRSRRYKATNMSFEEMVEMVAILKKEDYDGKKGPTKTPINSRPRSWIGYGGVSMQNLGCRGPGSSCARDGVI